MYIITGVSFVHALVQKPNLWILQREPVSIFIESRLNRLVLHNKIVLYINFVFVTSRNQPTILDRSDKVCYLQATLCCIPKFFTMFLKPFIFQIVKVNVSSMIEIRPYDILYRFKVMVEEFFTNKSYFCLITSDSSYYIQKLFCFFN